MNELTVQSYLRSGKTPADLKSELGINSYSHPLLPLIGFKYDQIESPKLNPIVRDCRGIVLERESWNVVAKPFRRFFNAGEDAESFSQFDWADFSATEKIDGSLIICYHYQGEWYVNTSGSFGLGECNFSGKTWRELFWETSGIDRSKLDPKFTLLFELWTPYNKVVRTYPKPSAWLIGAFHNESLEEQSRSALIYIGRQIGTPLPEYYSFSGHDDIAGFLQERTLTDKTFEGVVVRDSKDERYKVKSQTYLVLHHLFDNGNVFNPKRLVPLVLAGETDEVLAYLPEVKPHLERVQESVTNEYNNLVELWGNTWQIPDQKEFALSIVGKTPFSGILFNFRKMMGQNQTQEELTKLWRSSSDVIVKRLYS